MEEEYRLYSDLAPAELLGINTYGIKLTWAEPPNVANLGGGIFIYKDAESCSQAVFNWRAQVNTALKPAFVALMDADDPNAYNWSNLADYFSDIYTFPWNSIKMLSNQLNEAVKYLNLTDEILSMPETRLLAFAMTRNIRTITMKPSLNSKYGFTWPLARPFFKDYEEGEERDALEDLVDQGILSRKVREVISTCPYCGGAYLNIRKACPECGSAEIQSQTVIHHYPCGAVFTEQEAFRDGELWCVKCKKKLIHVGVDFDRPASIEKCSECGFTSEAFPQEAICFRCQHKFPLSEAREIAIHEYVIIIQEHKSLRDQLLQYRYRNFLELASFQAVLASERKLAERHGRKYSLIRAVVDNVKGKDNERFFVQQLINLLRKSDFITKSKDKEYMILLRETSDEQSFKVINRLKSVLSPYVSDFSVVVQADAGSLDVRVDQSSGESHHLNSEQRANEGANANCSHTNANLPYINNPYFKCRPSS